MPYMRTGKKHRLVRDKTKLMMEKIIFRMLKMGFNETQTNIALLRSELNQVKQGFFF